MLHIEHTNDVHEIFRIFHDNLNILWISSYSDIYKIFGIQTEYSRNIYSLLGYKVLICALPHLILLIVSCKASDTRYKLYVIECNGI